MNDGESRLPFSIDCKLPALARAQVQESHCRMSSPVVNDVAAAARYQSPR